MEIHLFGAATPVGRQFGNLIFLKEVGWNVYKYARPSSNRDCDYHMADLDSPENFLSPGSSNHAKIYVSFAGIWKLAPFLDRLANEYPCKLIGLRGLIASSSSSVITKRFAVNSFDRQLVARLMAAEDTLLATCRRLSVPCRILRPTLVYGQVDGYGDRNLSRLLQLLRRLPVLPLPSQTGMRQPIHASQLAAVTLHLVQQLVGSGLDQTSPECLALGGDTTLSYAEMISALQQAQSVVDPARRCRLLPIPNSLFYSLAAPLLLASPKAFEAVLRIGADLSGFTPVHQLLGSEPQPFPVLPLA